MRVLALGLLVCLALEAGNVRGQPAQANAEAEAQASAGPPVGQPLQQNVTLPPLPYPTTAMAPAIGNETMTLHWTKHTQAYANNLNAALTLCPELRTKSLFQLVSSVGVQGGVADKCFTAVRNNGGGYFNHLLFFLHNLAPYGSQSFEKDASPALKAAIDASFGSFARFKSDFDKAAAGVFGSGWSWLCVSPASKTLNVTTTSNQDSPIMKVASQECVPILGLDVWEHAYYLDVQNRRPEYIAAFGNVTNWKGVSELYDQALAGTPLDLA